MWRIPIDISPTAALDEDEIQQISSNNDLVSILELTKQKLGIEENLQKLARLCPDEENKLMVMCDAGKLALVDLESDGQLVSLVSTTADPSKPGSGLAGASTRLSPKMTMFSWSPHFNGNIVAVAAGNNIYSKDMRIDSSCSNSWTIPGAHSQTVRDVDFNPNSQHYLASCGDDCEVKFWDVRGLTAPVLKLSHHSHWIWSIRYNTFHDHLLLSGSSDGNVNLLRASSIASQPYGCFVDDQEEEDDEDEENNENEVEPKSIPDQVDKPELKDGLVKTYKDHQDSVYCVEWSPSDPWIFASLSYDGQVMVNRVPSEEKGQLV